MWTLKCICGAQTSKPRVALNFTRLLPANANKRDFEFGTVLAQFLQDLLRWRHGEEQVDGKNVTNNEEHHQSYITIISLELVVYDAFPPGI